MNAAMAMLMYGLKPASVQRARIRNPTNAQIEEKRKAVQSQPNSLQKLPHAMPAPIART